MLKITTKTPDWYHWHRSGVVIVNSEHILWCIVGSFLLAAAMLLFGKNIFWNTR